GVRRGSGRGRARRGGVPAGPGVFPSRGAAGKSESSDAHEQAHEGLPPAGPLPGRGATGANAAQQGEDGRQTARRPAARARGGPGGPPPRRGGPAVGDHPGRAAGARLAVTPDGKSIVSVRGGKYVRVWDLETGKLKEARELP